MASGRNARRKLAENGGRRYNEEVRDLTEDEINHLRQEIEKEGRVEGDLRKEIQITSAG